MLVNIEYEEISLFGTWNLLSDDETKNPKKGFYITHLNFNHQVETEIIDEYPFHLTAGDDHRPSFGVCDYPEQVIEKFPTIKRSQRKFFITFSPIGKEEQPEKGGWRWKKWGPYIGEKEPQEEYLYDEPEIEKVYTFHVFEVSEHYDDSNLREGVL